MENIFYAFGGAWKKDSIRIQTETLYNTVTLIDLKSPLVQNPLFSIKQGNKLYDIIHFNDSQNIAISEKLRDLFVENGISGWDCFKIDIKNLKENYYAFVNNSKAGPIENLDELNSYETERVLFDIKTWGGTDIFYLENSLLNVCTEKVKDIFLKNKISNIEISLL